MSHLQSFGCKALFLNRRPNKGKFESRAIEGIFVGYADTSRGYRIWMPKDRKVIVARDVKFLNEINRSNENKDFTSDSTVNGKTRTVDSDTEPTNHRTAEIKISKSNDQCIEDSMEDTLDTPT